MTMYVHLFHGRNTLYEELDDWGCDGPVLGRLRNGVVTHQVPSFCRRS